MGVLLHVHNRNPALDPLSHPCDLGRLADALLLFDSVAIATSGFDEVVGLVSWLGLDETLNLVRSGALTFVLAQRTPQIIRTEQGDYELATLEHGSSHHPPGPVTRLRTKSELAYYLRGRFSKGRFLPLGWSSSPGLEAALVSATNILDPMSEDRVFLSIDSILSRPDGSAALSAELAKSAERPSALTRGFILDKGVIRGPTLSDTEAEHALSDYNALVECLHELALGAQAGSDQLTSPLGEIAMTEAAIAGRGTPAEVVATFRTICELHGLARVQDAVFRLQLPASEIIALRGHPDAVRFRAWLRQAPAHPERKDEMLGRYVQAVASVVTKDSTVFSFLRMVGIAAISALVDPLSGLLLGGTEWAVGEWLAKPRWRPSIFVDGALKKALRQQRGEYRDVSLPFDPAPLLRERLVVSAFSHGLQSTRLRIEDSSGREAWNIEYDDSDGTRVVLNRRLADLRASAIGEFTICCYSCGERRELLHHEGLDGLTCRKCRSPLFPLVRR